MATSSITHNFIVRDPKAAERLAKALEESANDPPRPFTVDAKFLDDPDEIRELILKVNRTTEERASAQEEKSHG